MWLTPRCDVCWQIHIFLFGMNMKLFTSICSIITCTHLFSKLDITKALLLWQTWRPNMPSREGTERFLPDQHRLLPLVIQALNDVIFISWQTQQENTNRGTSFISVQNEIESTQKILYEILKIVSPFYHVYIIQNIYIFNMAAVCFCHVSLSLNYM